MELGSLLFLLLLLACPLAMVLMMRGGHGAHGHGAHGSCGHGSHDHGAPQKRRSVEELRRRRAELDDEIADLERAEGEAERVPAA